MMMVMSTTLLLLLCLTVLVAKGTNARCPVGFHSHRSSCYWFSPIIGTFAEARSYCDYLGSHLATVETHSEDVYLRGYATRSGKAADYLLGGSDLNVQGRWTWEGDKPMQFKNWGPGEPNNSHENCLGMIKFFGYKWSDYSCNVKANFICEKEI